MQIVQYQKLYAWFTARPAAMRRFQTAYRYTPFVVVVAYAALLALRGGACLLPLVQGVALPAGAVQALLLAVVVPAGVYVLGTWLRAALNYPRPYQQEGFIPLITKDKMGHACPSRHVLSASVIAVAWWGASPLVACGLGLVALVVAALRVIAGVHSLRDVCAGLAFGGGVGALAMAVLPHGLALLGLG